MNDLNHISFLVAMIVPAALGFGAISFALPPRLSWLRVSMATGVGTGICAIVFFTFRRPMFGVEAALVALAAWLCWRRRNALFRNMDFSTGSGVLFAVVVMIVTVALQALIIKVYRMPHGSWDGWAIWNWEARLLYRGGSHWRDYLPFAYHGDYPLLVPSTTARFWRYMGMEVPEASAWLGIVMAFSSMAALGLTLAELRGATLGGLFAITLISTPNYLAYAASQYADIPVSFFFLACLALIAIYFERSSEPDALRMLGVAGFAAGCACWTKNEGILFIVGCGAGFLFLLLRDRLGGIRRLGAFAAGLAIPLIVTITFKLTNHVQNYVVAYEPGKLQKALDLSRHEMILRYSGQYFLSFGVWAFSPYIPLLAFIFLTGVSRSVFASRGWQTIAVILVTLVAGYYAVYLTTPVELKVHIETSMDRLYLQLWPSLLLLAGLTCRSKVRFNMQADRNAVV
jgi:hypothetical protein